MLTPRLNTITEYIHTKTVADIGTDHAYIPIHIVQNNISEHVIATDLRKGPLLIAENNIRKNGLSDKIELRLGSGLSPVKCNEVETFIIAGMGGELITNILKEDKFKAENAECLILQPMNSQDMLRKWLAENNFFIIKEDLAVEEYKVYNIFIVKKGIPRIYEDEFELHVPTYLCDNKYFYDFKEKKKREFLKIKNGLENANIRNEILIDKYLDFLEKINNIK